MLSVVSISKRFGALNALDHISFRVAPASICALLGPNGAGKSTLLKVILGLLKPDEGSVRWSEPAPRSALSFVPEEAGLYDRMRVHAVVEFFGRLAGLSARDVRSRLPAWLDRLQLSAKGHVRVSELSKGNQQKVKLLCALIHQPRLLILDEPFTGLDDEGSAILRHLLLQLRAEGRTVLLSSHRLDQIEQLADHIVVLGRGRLLLDSDLTSARQLFRRNAVEAHFAGSFPLDLRPPGVASCQSLNGDSTHMRFLMKEGADPTQLLRALLDCAPALLAFEQHRPDLREILVGLTSSPGDSDI